MDPLLTKLVDLGAAGAVIIVVVLFLKFQREQAEAARADQKQREQEWREFITITGDVTQREILKITAATTELAALVNLVSREVMEHDAKAQKSFNLLFRRYMEDFDDENEDDGGDT